jgi:hypothetical protein
MALSLGRGVVAIDNLKTFVSYANCENKRDTITTTTTIDPLLVDDRFSERDIDGFFDELKTEEAQVPPIRERIRTERTHVLRLSQGSDKSRATNQMACQRLQCNITGNVFAQE